MTDMVDTAQSDEDLQMLRDSVRTLLDRAGGLDRARAARGDRQGWNAGVMQELAEAGVLGVSASEDAGGLGMGLPAAGVIAEEIGRVAAPEPVVATVGLVVSVLEQLCPDDALLAQVISGEKAVALAWQERGPAGLSETLDCRFDGKTITGAKAWVVGFASADVVLVLAQSDAGPTLLRLDAAASGVSAQSQPQSDGNALHELTFSAAAGDVIAQGANVEAAMAQSQTDATALAACELLGLSNSALELTLDYIRTREQFGKPIGSFQVIQHRAVDMQTAQEIAQAGVREALALMATETDAGERARLASRAKARACTAASLVTREAIRLHGAVGYTDEYDVGMFLNRALVLSAWLGDAAVHRRRWLDATLSAEAAQ